jgi:hypothetical protein
VAPGPKLHVSTCALGRAYDFRYFQRADPSNFWMGQSWLLSMVGICHEVEKFVLFALQGRTRSGRHSRFVCLRVNFSSKSTEISNVCSALTESVCGGRKLAGYAHCNPSHTGSF